MSLKTWKAIDVALFELEGRVGLPDFDGLADEIREAIRSLSLQTNPPTEERMLKLKKIKECHDSEEESKKRKKADMVAHSTLQARREAKDTCRKINDAIRMALLSKDIITADRLLDELIVDYPHEEMTAKLREARDRVAASIKDDDRETVKNLLPVNDLIAIASSEGAPQIVVSWTSEDSGFATEYRVVRKNLKGNGTKLFICADSPLTDTGIAINVPYRYAVMPCFRGIPAEHVALETDDVIATDSFESCSPVDDRIDGRADMLTQAQLVVCPICGWHNLITATFKCRVCGKDYLCHKHFSEAEKCCVDCALVMASRRKEKKEETLTSRNVIARAGDVKTLVLPGGVAMEMIYCAPGEFMMGSPQDEEGRDQYDETFHLVQLTRGFWLGKYPVTQEEWQSVMGTNPSRFKNNNRLPVECVSWKDCKEFVDKVNESAIRQLGCEARFPSEAEWEYACRAGTTTAYSWGNSLNGDKANCDGHGPCGTKIDGAYLRKTTTVGSYAANIWGFYDMHGNVWEWCADWHGDYYGGVDPQGPVSGSFRVLRGGSWFQYARYCRSASRNNHSPWYDDNETGFRLCCSSVV